MQLPGRLDSTTLGDLLGKLYRGSATGVLELFEIAATAGTRHGRSHRIHLLSGLVAGVETDLSITPIGELLVRQGKLDPRAVDAMLYRMAIGDPRPAGAILVSMGAVASDALVAGLRAQLSARMEAIYKSLTDARVTFRTSRPLPKDALRIGPLMPRDFLHGRRRKRDIAPSARAPQSPPQSTREPWWQTNGWGAYNRADHDAAPQSAAPQSAPPHSVPPHSVPPHSVPPQSGPRARSQAASPPSSPRDAAWRLLGLAEGADELSLRRAFKKLAMELHPDRHATAPEEVRAKNAARFAEVSAAFHLLVA